MSVSEYENRFWDTWGRFLDHVVPAEGTICAGCRYASDPKTYCNEGRKLWEAHRQAWEEYRTFRRRHIPSSSKLRQPLRSDS